MNIEELTLKDVRELNRLFNINNSSNADIKPIDEYAIVVLDKGFVYVGRLKSYDSEYYVLEEGSNIRIWGTTNGLGELVLKGKTSNTKLDTCNGIVKIPKRVIVSIHITNEILWKH
jgi:hypothetical protein